MSREKLFHISTVLVVYSIYLGRYSSGVLFVSATNKHNDYVKETPLLSSSEVSKITNYLNNSSLSSLLGQENVRGGSSSVKKHDDSSFLRSRNKRNHSGIARSYKQQEDGRRRKRRPVFGDQDALGDVRKWNFGEAAKKTPSLISSQFTTKTATTSSSYKHNIALHEKSVSMNSRKKKKSSLKNHGENIKEPELPPIPSPGFGIDQYHTFNEHIDERNMPEKISTVTESHVSSSSDNLKKLSASTSGHNNNHVLYRYFGRNRALPKREDSVPFIILGPSVDHWKNTGKILASRGFNVIACQRIIDDEKHGGFNDRSSNHERLVSLAGGEGENLVISILDALRWKKAILVGCDSESILAIEAAQYLAPQRIAGLILCGNLMPSQQRIYQLFKEHDQASTINDILNNPISLTIDKILPKTVQCPSTIIWNGDTDEFPDLPSDFNYDMLTQRTEFAGGGKFPFLRVPEQFAWVLSQFVEERVLCKNNGINDENIFVNNKAIFENQQEYGKSTKLKLDDPKCNIHTRQLKNKLSGDLVDLFDHFFLSRKLLASGRLIASAIVYLSFARVTFFHYTNIQTIHSSFLDLDVWQKQLKRYCDWLKFRANKHEKEFENPTSIDKEESKTSGIEVEQNGDKIHKGGGKRFSHFLFDDFVVT